MGTLVTEDILRAELHLFAEHTLRSYFADLGGRLRDDLVADLRGLLKAEVSTPHAASSWRGAGGGVAALGGTLYSSTSAPRHCPSAWDGTEVVQYTPSGNSGPGAGRSSLVTNDAYALPRSKTVGLDRRSLGQDDDALMGPGVLRSYIQAAEMRRLAGSRVLRQEQPLLPRILPKRISLFGSADPAQFWRTADAVESTTMQPPQQRQRGHRSKQSVGSADAAGGGGSGGGGGGGGGGTAGGSEAVVRPRPRWAVARSSYEARYAASFFRESPMTAWEEGLRSMWWFKTLAAIVESSTFDYISSFCIAVNAVIIGLQTDYAAKYPGDDMLPGYRAADVTFCVVFTVELLLRLLVHQWHFFVSRSWKYNIFDIVIVALMLVEEVLEVFAQSTRLNFSFMRVLRILRLIRIVRLFRVLRAINELRTIVSSIAGCMKSLFSTVVLLLLMIYVVGVFYTQLVSDHHANHLDDGRDEDLHKYFGSLSRSLLVLYQAMSGGVDWRAVVEPLITRISPFVAVLFCFYVAFAVLALMNVVTGVFVESGLRTAKEDQDLYMVNHLRQLLQTTNCGGSGGITWKDFESQLGNPQMIELFKSIDVDLKEARGLFDLLDMNDAGSILPDDFVAGCLRLRGPAKSLDLSLLIHEWRRLMRRHLQHMRFVEAHLDHLTASAPQQRPQTAAPEANPLMAVEEIEA